MQTPHSTTCPYLGLASDPTLSRSHPGVNHRCYAQDPDAAIEEEYQFRYCLSFSDVYSRCPIYQQTDLALVTVEELEEYGDPDVVGWSVWNWLFVGAIAITIMAVIFIYGRALFLPGGDVATPSLTEVATPMIVDTPAPVAPGGTAATETPIPVDTPTPGPPPDGTSTIADTPAPIAPGGSDATETPMPVDTPTPTPYVTPTSEPGGRVIGFKPGAGDAGWWGSNDTRGNHLGDSFLYSGYFEDQVFLSAFRLDFERVPRGAPLRGAVLRLTGLNADRFASEAGGTWTVSFLQADAFEDFRRADFQTLLNAPAAVTLVPALTAPELSRGEVNAWQLDPSALVWLEEQLLAGNNEVIVRVLGPTGGGQTLFAWDSGTGPSSAGAAPELQLNIGAPPATPPATPTQAVIIATLTPTPENVLTVAAGALIATARAARNWTVTPVPVNIVTPTPLPENRATAEADAVASGLPPLVVNTPRPASPATATARSLYATAVAVTTGTFTPVPEDAITPSIITPTPVPENLATQAAQVQTAKGRALLYGTPTPLPYHVIVATTTPSPVVIASTPTPESIATATANAVRATAIAVITGTFTPIPTNAVTPTPTATPTSTSTPTPLPLLVYQTATPLPTPTTVPERVPPFLVGKVLFRSNRPSPMKGNDTGLWMYDSQNGSLAYLTQQWPYAVAQAAERMARRPQGIYRLSVEPDIGRNLQIFVYDPEYDHKYQVNSTAGTAYDPSWSSNGERIAFVSTEPGNDEIYLVDRNGTNQTRLTFNDWEWDKHPSLSPNGSRIVFESNRVTGHRQLWVMNADGSNQQPFVRSAYDDWGPIWVK